jgi:streptogramin lyase
MPVEPWGISEGPDGNVWFTEARANRIGRITPRGGITEFPIPRRGSPTDITCGADGNLWFSWSEAGGSNVYALGRVHTSGEITLFETPIGLAPQQLTSGPDGAIWYATVGGIGRFDPINWSFEAFSPKRDVEPWGITTGPDQNLWFTILLEPAVGRLTAAGDVGYFQAPAPTLGGIAAGPDGNLWFPVYGPGPTPADIARIVRMTPAGAVVSDFVVRFPTALPYAITTGPDGNVWFREQEIGSIGRVTPAGSIIDVLLPSGRSGRPQFITSAADGNLWFTEPWLDRIGRITPNGEVTEFSIRGYPWSSSAWRRPSEAIQRTWMAATRSADESRRRVARRPRDWQRARLDPEGEGGQADEAPGAYGG